MKTIIMTTLIIANQYSDSPGMIMSICVVVSNKQLYTPYTRTWISCMMNIGMIIMRAYSQAVMFGSQYCAPVRYGRQRYQSNSTDLQYDCCSCQLAC